MTIWSASKFHPQPLQQESYDGIFLSFKSRDPVTEYYEE
jgi:hypothetical protein